MANYRCPVCGASHKTQEDHCRLCGASMTEVVTIQGAEPATTALGNKKGVGVVLGIGVLAVVGITLLAALFGWISFPGGKSGEVVETIQDEFPGLSGQEVDGWAVVDDADGGFTVEMPGTPERRVATFPASSSGQANQLVATIGDETELSVSWAPVSAPEEPTRAQEDELLRSTTESWIAAQGGKVLNVPVSETTQNGHHALQYTAERMTLNGEPATAQGVVFLSGDTVYILQSFSVYPDHAQFGRLRSTFALT